jgi:membrane protein required for beta-lactamase induction
MTALLLLVVCCLVSAALAMWAAPAVQFLWVALLLSVIVGMLVLRSGQRDESSTGLLETPFYSVA